MTDEEYRHFIKEAMRTFHEGPFNENQWDEFSSISSTSPEDLEKMRAMGSFVKKWIKYSFPVSGGHKETIYYMAVPPEFTPVVVEKLENHRLCKENFNTKIIVEKPFGRDYASAVQLNRILRKAFDERSDLSH